ncbi:MAG: hypothetical protein LBG58_15790 [Planctomycetaceae bacterium]|nr:hypothetical protein [Planctomycetaceae bacterium]
MEFWKGRQSARCTVASAYSPTCPSERQEIGSNNGKRLREMSLTVVCLD